MSEDVIGLALQGALRFARIEVARAQAAQTLERNASRFVGKSRALVKQLLTLHSTSCVPRDLYLYPAFEAAKEAVKALKALLSQPAPTAPPLPDA